MLAYWRWAGLCFMILALFVPNTGAQDKSDPDKKGDKKEETKKATKAEVKEKFVPILLYTGKIKAVQATQKMLTVEVNFPVLDPAKEAEVQRWYAQKVNEIRTSRNAGELVQRQQSLANELPRRQQEMYKMTPRDLPIQCSDDVRVRLTVLPVEFDDKGNQKKYSAAELKEKKGPENLVGYTAEFEALSAGQTVQLYMSKKDAMPMKTTPAKGKAKTDEDASNPDVIPTVMMVVIIPGQ